MLELEKIRELLGDEKIPDQEIEDIRDMARALSELMFSAWAKKLGKEKPDDQDPEEPENLRGP